MFQCPLMRTCIFFYNVEWGADIYKEFKDEKEYATINCQNCIVLDNEKYQNIVIEMQKNDRSYMDIFGNLKFYIDKDRGVTNDGK